MKETGSRHGAVRIANAIASERTGTGASAGRSRSRPESVRRFLLLQDRVALRHRQLSTSTHAARQVAALVRDGNSEAGDSLMYGGDSGGSMFGGGDVTEYLKKQKALRD